MKKMNWIEPAAGYDPVIARWVWMLEETRQRTKEALAGVVETALNWAPPDGGNSMGTLLYHIVAIELDWLYAEILEIQDFPQEVHSLLPYEVRDATGRLTVVQDESLETHLTRLDAGRTLFLSKLRSMSRDDFYRVRHLEPYDVTPEWVLYHLMHHEAEHCGQIWELHRAPRRFDEYVPKDPMTESPNQ